MVSVLIRILENIKVIVKLIIPWINFIKEYFLSEMLNLPVKDEIWPIIDKPENEQIKLIALSLNIIDEEIEVKILQPFVYSMEPRKIPYNELGDNDNTFSILLKIIFIKELFFIIPIIIEKIITKAPTCNVVLIAFSIDVFIITPKL